MKKMRFLIMSLAALSIMSCSKEGGDNNVDTTPKSVFVKIGLGSLVSGDAPVTGTTTATEIKELNLFFVNAAGGVVYNKAISEATDPTLEQVKAGFKFENVNGSATKVFIVANNTTNNGTDNIDALTTLGAIQNEVLETSTQNPAVTDAIPSWNHVTMMGEGAITGAADAKTAAVAIAPIMARMEIHKITGEAASIASFKLKGIFINNHYKKITIGGAASGTINLYAGVDDYVAANFSGYSDIGADLALETVGKCYGYQVVPAAGTNIPHIVLHLGDVNIVGPDGNPQPIADDQYITVKTYKGAGDAALTSMLANNVYKISDIQFTASNLTDKPETEDQSVTVTVTTTAWTVNDITPDL